MTTSPTQWNMLDAKESKITQTMLANCIRALAMDAVEAAQSGHPGMPMGFADVATVLFTKFLKFDPSDPGWADRDRFVLSAGHGSMLLYSLLYLTGYEDMTIDQLKNFRQLHSRTAGHPEYGEAKGIETTTGPLGQGLGNAVGMALAEKILKAKFGKDLVDHYTYCVTGDGCLMEGISHEAISLAGHLQLDNLVVFFDDNNISIDGSTDLAVSDDQLARFKAAGWDVQAIDGHDPEAIEKAILKAQKSDKPSMIACKTTIGYGAPNKQGTAATHGAPLGEEEVAGTRRALGWTHEPFIVPDELLNFWRDVGRRGQDVRQEWQERLEQTDPTTRSEFERVINGRMPDGWQQAMEGLIRQWTEEAPALATRKASGKVLDVLTQIVPELVGGSADLSGSNNTKAGSAKVITANSFAGNYIHYGVREHAMAAAMNGMSLHGGIIPFGGTFLVFTDYCRPSIRLSALMNRRIVYVMTHDSIGLGEDGPTHQPIEHLSGLRAMPNLFVFRPADAVETAECWKLALEQQFTPSVIALTRQSVPALRTKAEETNMCARGGYVLQEASGDKAKVTLIATGSEVSLATEAREMLEKEEIPTRVVSMPCWELFDQQSADYRETTLAPDTLRVGVEAAIKHGWEKYLGPDGIFVGMDGFGASAPYKDLYKHFGLTAEHIVNKVKEGL